MKYKPIDRSRRAVAKAILSAPAVASSGFLGSWAYADAVRKADILIYNTLIVTADDKRNVIPNGAVAISNGRIVAIGDTDEIVPYFEAQSLVDGSRKMVMPGLVNTHIHAALDRYVGLGLNVPKNAWINETALYDGGKGEHKPHPLGYLDGKGGFTNMQKAMYDRLAALERIDEQTAYTSALHTMAVEIFGGTTTFIESAGGSLDAVAEATQASGLRGVMTNFVYDLTYDPAEPDKKMQRVRDTDEMLAETEANAARFRNAADGRISWFYSLFSGTTASDGLIRGIKDLADRDATGIYSHSSAAWDHDAFNVMAHGMRCVERLDAFDVLGPKWLGVHMGWLTDSEIKRLGDTRSNVCHALAAGMLYGKGITTTKVWPKLIDAGVNLTFGTDDKWNGTIFQEARLAHTVHKDVWGDSRYFPYYQIAEMLTRNGAAALGLEDCGTLARGKKADMIMVDIDHPRYFDVDGPLSIFLTRGEAADISTMIVDGKFVMKDREILTFDLDKLLYEYRQLSKA